LNEYKIKNLTVQHFDLFRIKDGNETKNIGLFENYNDILTFIEWPEKIIDKPKKKYELYFKYEHKSEKRFISIYKDSLEFTKI
jgi:tRNA A37 threonylcarbamoyladenosine biosynthesis protein TsaE